MKIQCSCGAQIIDQTDYLSYKGYLISDTQWFDFWDAIDAAIEKEGTSMQKEQRIMELRKMKVFRMLWECSNCGKLYIDGQAGKLHSYQPDSESYNRILDKM